MIMNEPQFEFNRISGNVVTFAEIVVTAVRQILHRCNRRIR